MDAEHVTFRFFAESGLGRTHIMELKDIYQPSSMRPQMECRVVAEDPSSGYIF